MTTDILSLVEGDWDRASVAQKAAAMFPNTALKPIAALMASVHPRALEYIRLAPVLVLGASTYASRNTLKNRQYIASSFGAKAHRGDKLRDVMASYGLGYQLRALKPRVLHPIRWKVIYRLGKIHPSTLAQVIPHEAAAQDIWLRSLTRWCTRLARLRQDDTYLFFDWAAAALTDVARGHERSAADIADFAFSNQGRFNTKWTLAQARAAEERWHRELAQKRDEQDFFTRHGVRWDDEIDISPLPEEWACAGLTFHALRSGEALWLEGRAMHHCVSTYSDRVLKGWSRIYSIRNEGKRLATLELTPAYGATARQYGHRYTVGQLKGPCNKLPGKIVTEAAFAFLRVVNELVTERAG